MTRIELRHPHVNPFSGCTRLLADFKRPREVRLIDCVPRSTVEKIAKAKLRERLAMEFGQAPAEHEL